MNQKIKIEKGDKPVVVMDSSGRNVWLLGMNNIILGPEEAIKMGVKIIKHAAIASMNRKKPENTCPVCELLLTLIANSRVK